MWWRHWNLRWECGCDTGSKDGHVSFAVLAVLLLTVVISTVSGFCPWERHYSDCHSPAVLSQNVMKDIDVGLKPWIQQFSLLFKLLFFPPLVPSTNLLNSIKTGNFKSGLSSGCYVFLFTVWDEMLTVMNLSEVQKVFIKNLWFCVRKSSSV